MNRIISLVVLMMFSTLLVSIDYKYTVNHPSPSNPAFDFDTIQEAITESTGNQNILTTDSIDIIVYPNPGTGFYEANITICVSGEVPDLTIQSYESGRISLYPEYFDTAIFKLIVYGYSDDDLLTIKGFDFYNNNPSDNITIADDHDGNYAIYSSAKNVTIDDCNFNPQIRRESFVHDIYLFQEGDKSPRQMTVANCNFNQDLSWDRFLAYSRIVGYLNNPNSAISSYEFNALNNNFTNNKKSIDMHNALKLKIEGNTSHTLSIGEVYDRMYSFYLEVHGVVGLDIHVLDNYISNSNNAFYILPMTANTFCNNHVLDTVESFIVCSESNLFSNNIFTFDDIITYNNATFGIAPPTLKNNTFYRNPQQGDIQLNLTVDNVLNNIIYGFDDSDIYFASPTGNVSFIANLFDPNLNFSETNLNLNGEPNFNDVSNNDFSLVWPCKAIGNGFDNVYNSPEPGLDMKLLTYQDDTIDIGAIPFNEDRKQYHHFEGGTTTKNWTGFPALDPENETTIFYDGINQTLPNNNMIVMFQDFTDYQGNYASVGYKDWDDYNNYVSCEFIWGNFLTDPALVQPYLGYKITAQNDIDHWFGGLLQDPDMNIPLPSTSNEIWLGYHVPYTTDALVAFNDILGSLQTIKHKDWAMYWNGTEWTGKTSTGNTNIEMGDFIAITYRSSVQPPSSFNWTYYAFSNPNSFRYQDASYVSYEEKSDYTSFFIDIDENSNIEEIALYANDECIGGAKTQGEATVMVKAFMEDVPEDSEISIVAFTGAKTSKKVKHLAEYNSNLQVWNNTDNIIKDSRIYYHVSLTKDNTSIIETNQIITTNYPNPFNPETTIEFNNPVQGQVSVNIYNLKGQLVKSLLKDNLNQGVHKVIWRGNDSNDQQVASGVYFYKISSGNNKSVTKKIILMK